MTISPYFPPDAGGWQHLSPEEAGLDPALLDAALAFADAHESAWPRDLDTGHFLPTLTADEPPPWNEIIGPMAPRGGPAGLFLKSGRIVASWGDPDRPDMTFSIAKSFLAVLAGIAVRDGLIADLDEPVADSVGAGLFDDPQNRDVTWRHLLQQTSEWQGTLFSKPDQVDHFRELGRGATNARKGQKRALQAPGTYWEYNDVRVNLLSLCLLHLFRRPLPDVLAETVMDPIGASRDWAWWGYDNADVAIGGRTIRSVPGGSHWGGGLRISARDQTRFALLIAHDGCWQDRRILPEGWVGRMMTPCAINPQYGFLWWLNTGRGQYPSAPETSVFAMGAGSNLIWIDTQLDIIMVARWIAGDDIDGLIAAFMRALNS